MRINLYITVISVIVFCLACNKETDFQESVYVYDKSNPELPQYTEWGYNTFGAYFDRETFVSNNSDVPVKVVVSNDSTMFLLKGQKSGENTLSEMTLRIYLNHFLPNNLTDLLDLHGRYIDLVEDSAKVVISIGNEKNEVELISGHIEFKRAQNLKVDGQFVEIILSGYFDIQFIMDDEPMTLYLGRFDIGINDGNFFVLD